MKHEIYEDNGGGLFFAPGNDDILIEMPQDGDALTDCRMYLDSWCSHDFPENRHVRTDDWVNAMKLIATWDSRKNRLAIETDRNGRSMAGSAGREYLGIDDGPPNARFWIWENDGWIKLTIRPSQTLKWWCGSDTEEGWSAHGCEWHLCGPHVYAYAWTDGVDCDGRLSAQAEFVCPVSELLYEGDSPEAPNWERESASQRDYAAEAMGY